MLSRPAPARRREQWRPSGRGSFLRPPTKKRLFVLQPPDALAQQLLFHGQLSNDRLHPAALITQQIQIFLPDLEYRLSASQEGVAPGRQGGGSDGIFAAEGFQVGAAEQLEHGLGLALGRPATLATVAGLRDRFGRPPGFLRAPGNRTFGDGPTDPPDIKSVSNKIVGPRTGSFRDHCLPSPESLERRRLRSALRRGLPCHPRRFASAEYFRQACVPCQSRNAPLSRDANQSLQRAEQA